VSALQSMRDVCAGLRSLRIDQTEVVADHEDDDAAVKVLRGLVHLESILAGAIRELQTPETERVLRDAGFVPEAEPREEPEDAPEDGHLVLAPADRETVDAVVADLEKHTRRFLDVHATDYDEDDLVYGARIAGYTEMLRRAIGGTP
jgi:ferric-dicitrate binding protein FerR (iron transport regulator)